MKRGWEDGIRILRCKIAVMSVIALLILFSDAMGSTGRAKISKFDPLIIQECTFGNPRRAYTSSKGKPFHLLGVVSLYSHLECGKRVPKKLARHLVKKVLFDHENRKILHALRRIYFKRHLLMLYRKNIRELREVRKAEERYRIVKRLSKLSKDPGNYPIPGVNFPFLVDYAGAVQTLMQLTRDIYAVPLLYEKIYRKYKKEIRPNIKDIKNSHEMEYAVDMLSYDIELGKARGDYFLNRQTLARKMGMDVKSEKFKEWEQRLWVTLLEQRYQQDKFLKEYEPAQEKLNAIQDKIIQFHVSPEVSFGGKWIIQVVSRKNGACQPVEGAQVRIAWEETAMRGATGADGSVVFEKVCGALYTVVVQRKNAEGFQKKIWFVPEKLSKGDWGNETRIILPDVSSVRVYPARKKVAVSHSGHSIRGICPLKSRKYAGKERKIYTSADHKDCTYCLYYKNGQLRSEISGKRGFTEGLQLTFFDNGQIRQVYYIRHRKKSGMERWYYRNRQLRLECFWKDGKRVGMTRTFYSTGQLKAVVSYRDGKKDGLAKRYRRNGELYQCIVYENGKPVRSCIPKE